MQWLEHILPFLGILLLMLVVTLVAMNAWRFAAWRRRLPLGVAGVAMGGALFLMTRPAQASPLDTVFAGWAFDPFSAAIGAAICAAIVVVFLLLVAAWAGDQVGNWF